MSSKQLKEKASTHTDKVDGESVQVSVVTE